MAEPIPAEICASCAQPYFDGCPVDHEHSGLCFDGISDVRRLWCGCYAHKSCQKNGNTCREHGFLTVADPRLPEVGQVYRHRTTGQVWVVVEVHEDGSIEVVPWVPAEPRHR